MVGPAELLPTVQKVRGARLVEEDGAVSHPSEVDGNGYQTPGTKSSSIGAHQASAEVAFVRGKSGAVPVRPSPSPAAAIVPSRFSPEVLARAAAVAYPAAATLGLTGSRSPDVIPSRGPSPSQTGGPGATVVSPGFLPSSVMVTPYVSLENGGRGSASGGGALTFRLTVLDSSLADAGTPVTLFGGREAEGRGPGKSSAGEAVTRRGALGHPRQQQLQQGSEHYANLIVAAAAEAAAGRVRTPAPKDREVWDAPGKGDKLFAPPPCFYPSGVGPAPSVLQYSAGVAGREGKQVEENVPRMAVVRRGSDGYNY